MEEFDELFKTFDDANAALFKFQSLFSVETERLRDPFIQFLEHASGPVSHPELFIALFKKCRKMAFKKQTPVVCRRMLWFIVQKLLEENCFSRPARRDIQIWCDMCLERTYEGHAKVMLQNGSAELIVPSAPQNQNSSSSANTISS